MSGRLVISIDTELAWGYHDLNQFGHLSASGIPEREALDEVLNLFENYDISATWAVVGHLFHESCDGVHEGSEGWFDNDPGTSVDADPLWYGPDIVDSVLNTPGQELGFHSYSHVVFDQVTRETARREFTRCKQLANDVGIQNPVFVFPRNRIGYLQELRDAGFAAYRETIDAWYQFDRRLPRMTALYLDYLLGMTVETFNEPIRHANGLVKVPGSLPLNRLDSPLFRYAGISDARKRRLLSGIKRAADRDETFHIWTHLYEFPERLEALGAVLSYAHELGVESVSMGDIAEVS